jgi:hypothetical protein
MADLRVSTTDLDASHMHQKKMGASRLGYQTHYVVDGGKARAILDAFVTPAEVNENLTMLELLFRSRFRWCLSPRLSGRKITLLRTHRTWPRFYSLAWSVCPFRAL